MAPRRSETAAPARANGRKKQGPGQDRRRDLEDKKHHPAKAVKSRTEHKPIKKPKLPPRHTPHSRPHGDELGPHANKPSPIKPRKTITPTGSQRKA